MRRTSRPTGCLSDYTLDRSLARELHGAERDEADAHLGACANCAARLSSLSRERDAFAREAPPLRPPSSAETTRAPRSTWRRRLLAGGAASAVAAAAAVFLFARDRPGEGDGTRAKGPGTRLGLFVNHHGNVRAGGAHERVAPGDGLRFVVTTTTARHVAVLSLDGARRASVYYPSAGAPPRVEAGVDIALPASTTLDDTLGDEVVYGVFCDAPFELEPLRQALEGAQGRAPLVAPPGCTVDELRLRKEAP